MSNKKLKNLRLSLNENDVAEIEQLKKHFEKKNGFLPTTVAAIRYAVKQANNISK